MQRRSQAVVDSILEAVSLLCEAGEGTPTVQAIADRAGVSVGSLYQYFSTKESVLNALIEFNLKRALRRTEGDFERVVALSPEAAARLMVRAIIASNSTRRRIEHALVRYFCRVGDLTSLTLHDDKVHQVIARFLRTLGPAIRPSNIELASFLIFNSVRAAVVMSIVQKPEQLDSAELEDELVRLIVAYLSPAP